MNRLAAVFVRIACAIDGHYWFSNATGIRCAKCRRLWSL